MISLFRIALRTLRLITMVARVKVHPMLCEYYMLNTDIIDFTVMLLISCIPVIGVLQIRFREYIFNDLSRIIMISLRHSQQPQTLPVAGISRKHGSDSEQTTAGPVGGRKRRRVDTSTSQNTLSNANL